MCAILQQPVFLPANNTAPPEAGSQIFYVLMGLHLRGPNKHKTMNGELPRVVRCSGNAIPIKIEV